MISTEAPIFQVFNIEGVRHITPLNAFQELQNGNAIMVDVRENPEFVIESIPLNDVFYFPMSAIMDNLKFIPNDKPIIVICKAGIRSTKVANLLKQNGFTNSVNLDGGIDIWKSQGLPLAGNISTECGCGCSCSK